MARNKQMMSYRPENQKSTTTVVATSTEPTYEAIQARAYQIFLARGDRAGSAPDDWFQAERELKAEGESFDE